MNQIKNYIEAMFSSLPKTREVVEMKLNILENMEEKFQELIKEGKNENEAIGIIIADFGSIDELKAELGITDDVTEIKPENDTPEQAFLQNTKLYEEYLTFKKKFGLAIAVAVGLFILAPAMYVVFESLYGETSILAIATFFLSIACGVGIFIYFGVQDDKYKMLLNIKDHAHSGKSSFSGLIASIIFPIATILFLYVGLFWNMWHPGWIVFPISGIIVGISESIYNFRHDKNH